MSNIVVQAKELLNRVLSSYKEEKNVFDNLSSFTITINDDLETFEIIIPKNMTFINNIYSSPFNVKKLILKKKNGLPVTRISFFKNNNITTLIFNLDCSRVEVFNISSLTNLKTIENFDFPLLNDYILLFPNTVTDINFVENTISPKRVGYVIDFSSNYNFTLSTIQSLCGAVQPLTEENIAENGGYGIIAFTSQVFSLITDELSEAFLSKGWEVYDNG